MSKQKIAEFIYTAREHDLILDGLRRVLVSKNTVRDDMVRNGSTNSLLPAIEAEIEEVARLIEFVSEFRRAQS